MKKRLRKKLRLQEFQYDGFAVCLKLNLADDDETRLPFWQKMEAAIESQGLYVIGRADDFWVMTNYNLVPVPAIRESDRHWMRDWIVQQPEIAHYRVRTPSYTWYPCYDHNEADSD
ncbi:50S ribosome-binding protein YggL [Hymenobacter caeli]|uniref:Uncharacterized protein YggL (DUF469 family) n=1 Tax=Hymenobacter caeli TaxID=2735894 RepID=A0ABX2FMX5_9BACT|nr:50S ribosome-binding protein YggL [Hymenobacter caeli]NRT18505.1 uncharacterized protein YggL (DUF469 family) [Hymenobacter caeli]